MFCGSHGSHGISKKDPMNSYILRPAVPPWFQQICGDRCAMQCHATRGAGLGDRFVEANPLLLLDLNLPGIVKFHQNLNGTLPTDP